MRISMLLLLLVCAGPVWGIDEISGIGFVRDDGTLRVANQTIHLFGVYLPTQDETCYTFIRPVMCGPRPVLALRLKVNGFVHCSPVTHRPDGSIDAVCRVGSGVFSEGGDLAEYLLQQGLAIARPDAPFEYHALERIARNRGIGIWGVPVEIPRH